MSEGYAGAAVDYWNAGWRSVLPLPGGKKFPPPNGYTGYNAEIPSFPDIMAWTENGEGYNLALRFPPNVIGLDVDSYGEKTGAATLSEALNRWGPLPPTVRSTSRTDAVSGIRLYRKPAEISLHTQIKFPGLSIGNIEIVQDHHRYCVSWPSIHPEGRMYEWRTESGVVVGIPNPDELPMLPQRWIDGLRADSYTEITAHRDPYEALKELPQGRMSPKVEKALERGRRELDCEPGSRHDVANANVLRLLRLGEQGETGVREALHTYAQCFTKATRDRNTESEAAGEFARMVFGQRGHDLIASTPSAQNDVDTIMGRHAPPAPPRAAQQASAAAMMVEEQDVDPEAAAMLELQRTLGANIVPGREIGFDGPPTEPAPEVEQMFGAPESSSMRDRLLTIEGLSTMRPAEPMIERLLYRNTLAQLSGEPGSGKTFLTLGMACAVASNLTSWHGHSVRGNGKVLYVAAEGTSGLYARIMAWCEQQQYPRTGLQLFVYPEAVQLGSWTQVEEICELVRQEEFALVVLDTRARCTVDLEENSATEQGKAIAAADMIRTASDCTVLCVHHGSRSSGSTPRGSNAWDGAVWSDLRVKTDQAKEGQIVVHVEKHKDAPSGFDDAFELKPWLVSTDLMPDAEEQVRSTLVAVSVDERPEKLCKDTKAMDEVTEVLKREAVQGVGLTVTEITTSLGCSRSKVNTAIKSLSILGRVHDGKKGAYVAYWVDEDENAAV